MSALIAIRPESAASNAWVTVTSRRRSTASATVPPMIGNTKTGISAASPSNPTASVEPVILKTWYGIATATISSPKLDTLCPKKSSRKSRETLSGVRSIRCPRARCRTPKRGGGSGRGVTGSWSTVEDRSTEPRTVSAADARVADPPGSCRPSGRSGST